MHLRRSVGARFCRERTGEGRDSAECRGLYSRHSGKVGLGDDQIHRQTRRKAGTQDGFCKSAAKDDALRPKEVTDHSQKDHANCNKARVVVVFYRELARIITRTWVRYHIRVYLCLFAVFRG